MLTGYTHGALDQSQRDDVAKAVLELKSNRQEWAGARQRAAQKIEADPNLLQFARRRASRRSATIARHATVRAHKGSRAIPISTTTSGCGAASRRHPTTLSRRALASSRDAPIADAAYGRDRLLEGKAGRRLDEYVG